MFDFSLVAKAGLTQREFAALVNVSRVAANAWISGRRRPQLRRHVRVERVMDLLGEWAETRPLDDLTDTQRERFLADVLHELVN